MIDLRSLVTDAARVPAIVLGARTSVHADQLAAVRCAKGLPHEEVGCCAHFPKPRVIPRSRFELWLAGHPRIDVLIPFLVGGLVGAWMMTLLFLWATS